MVDVIAPTTLTRPAGRDATATSGAATGLALAGVAVAAGSLAFSGPAGLTAGAAALAFVAAGTGALDLVRGARARRLDRGHPIAVTTTKGALVAVNAAFEAMMAERGRPAHPDALAEGDAAALALYSLRRHAIAQGRAEGYVPPDLLARLTVEGDHIVHRFEPATAPKASAAPLDATIVDLFPSAAVIVDPRGAIRAANAPYRALAGAGDTLADALQIDAAAIARLAAQATDERPSRVDAHLRRAPDRCVRLSAKPVPGVDGAIIVAVADVTEQSELEAQIAQSQKMQAIGQLAGGIAHDFNNVLTAIIGFSDLLLQSHRPSDPAFRDIMNIKQNAQRAAGLVKQLLAFSRRQTLRPTVLNLNDVVADLSMMLDRLLGETVQLDIAYGRDLWPVLADLSQIEQVVINLAVNARDAMPGGGKLTIRTRNVVHGAVTEGPEGAPESDAVLIEIEDVGTGMPQEILDKIFEPFFTTKATGEGTGLGLSTVYGIVKQTGGTLAVSSVEGEGTTFRVYLPRTEPEVRAASEEGKPREASQIGQGTPSADLTGSATLLLVEDEEAIRTFAARALSAKGYHVLSAASGVEAAEIFAEEGDTVDLLLTDVIMPELDGPSLVRMVREERPDLKVIFMSGYADGASVDELGDAQFLPKPFTLKALAEAVKRELGRT
ncbi:ATP-binding protein [Acuticoccus mangrovi]|uniref:histidine kinase n=1 Tax=Acuticoccus mangrovi TaxID=2796142 RepID=A0A934ITA3_9HYPH|nr:ATP-binding protein [Acuticoccus mangrovi]MBJ3778223.1 response regulator [Acuticoccus mangrovi]